MAKPERPPEGERPAGRAGTRVIRAASLPTAGALAFALAVSGGLLWSDGAARAPVVASPRQVATAVAQAPESRAEVAFLIERRFLTVSRGTATAPGALVTVRATALAARQVAAGAPIVSALPTAPPAGVASAPSPTRTARRRGRARGGAAAVALAAAAVGRGDNGPAVAAPIPRPSQARHHLARAVTEPVPGDAERPGRSKLAERRLTGRGGGIDVTLPPAEEFTSAAVPWPALLTTGQRLAEAGSGRVTGGSRPLL